jgi:two-component system phosphate regulon sensor histidine kinase PhoR
MKTDFINNMTHEFKTPIATISLAADSIGSPMIMSHPDKIKRFVDIIRQENRRMNSQVERVLQMA